MKQLIRFDWAIKRILRNKANFSVLEGFLTVLLRQEIKIDQILESESNQEDALDKFNKVDILVENSSGELILVEIQNNNELDYFHRMSYGVSKLTAQSLNLGRAYSEIKKVIAINIVYFDLGQGEDYVYHGKTNFIGLHKGDVLQLSNKQKSFFDKNEVAEIFPEFYLLKVNKFDDQAIDSLDEWIYFLKNSEIKENFTAKGLKEANEILDVLKLDDKERKKYQAYLENQTYQASMAITMKADAEEQIRIEERENLIKIFYDKGYNIQDTVDFTGFDSRTCKKRLPKIEYQK